MAEKVIFCMYSTCCPEPMWRTSMSCRRYPRSPGAEGGPGRRLSAGEAPLAGPETRVWKMVVEYKVLKSHCCC